MEKKLAETAKEERKTNNGTKNSRGVYMPTADEVARKREWSEIHML